jgi:hypothetical protein
MEQLNQDLVVQMDIAEDCLVDQMLIQMNADPDIISIKKTISVEKIIPKEIKI